LICYQRPFAGDGYDIIRAIMEDEFPSVASVVPECGSDVQAIIQRMLRKPSVDRYSEHGGRAAGFGADVEPDAL
jgi:hypothetical protein